MAVRRHSSEEFARRGAEICERVVKPTLKPEDMDRYVAIDIESEDFEINANDYAASKGLRARRPDAQIFIGRVGRRAAYNMGGYTYSGELRSSLARSMIALKSL
jgi:hypothetical protein